VRNAVLTLLIACALSLGREPPEPRASVVPCAEPATPVSKAVAGAHARASSYAPDAQAHRRVYGAPIQKPILKRRHRKPRAPAATGTPAR
jgi:hypothetical protein